MIDELAVKNLGIIESVRVEPGPGLTVITGETGTGKTLLLGALRLLLGGESRPDLIGPFAEEATVEGRFVDASGAEIGAGRRLPKDGRSRAYIDGSIASARALEETVAGLVDVVGQHDHISLTRPGEARAMVDRCLDAKGQTTAGQYQAAWDTLQRAVEARDRLGGDRSALARELDLVSFQTGEIDRAALAPGDDTALQAEADRLRHADEITELLAATLGSLETGREAIGQAIDATRRAGRLDPDLDRLAEDLGGLADAAAEIGREVMTAAERADQDPERLSMVESKLTEIGELKRKYGRTVDEILAFGATAAQRRDELSALLGKAGMIDQEVTEAEQAVGAAGEALMAARRRAGDSLAAAAVGHLLDLGFTDPVVEVAVEPAAPGHSGADTVSILFASDSRLTPGPVATVASGGELSRLVLALRLAGGRGDAATLVFDEVDAGIGGETALALGRKLAALAEDRQVLCVTHLPQVAAFADRHYVVARLDNRASVTRVDDDARVVELSRMLAGMPESDRGRQAAEELLAMATSA